MGIASMILGILSVMVGFIPCVGWVAFIPALVGFILGIVDVVIKKKQALPRGMGIAGITCNTIAIVVILCWLFLGALIFGAPAALAAQQAHQAAQQAHQEALNNVNTIK